MADHPQIREPGAGLCRTSLAHRSGRLQNGAAGVWGSLQKRAMLVFRKLEWTRHRGRIHRAAAVTGQITVDGVARFLRADADVRHSGRRVGGNRCRVTRQSLQANQKEEEELTAGCGLLAAAIAVARGEWTPTTAGRWCRSCQRCLAAHKSVSGWLQRWAAARRMNLSSCGRPTEPQKGPNQGHRGWQWGGIMRW